jgi:hypothetical protein
MGHVRNTSGEDLFVPDLGGRLVLKGQVIEVPDEKVYGYTCQTETWSAADSDTAAVHDEAAERDAAALAAERGTPETVAELDEPAGNASRDEWAAWVTGTGQATDDDLKDLGRDAIRDKYQTPDTDDDQSDDSNDDTGADGTGQED